MVSAVSLDSAHHRDIAKEDTDDERIEKNGLSGHTTMSSDVDSHESSNLVIGESLGDAATRAEIERFVRRRWAVKEGWETIW